jgi:hypothetical protein
LGFLKRTALQKAGIRIAEPEKNFPRQCYASLLYSESARSLCHPSDFFENTYDSHGIHEAVKAILSRYDIPLAYSPQPF